LPERPDRTDGAASQAQLPSLPPFANEEDSDVELTRSRKSCSTPAERRDSCTQTEGFALSPSSPRGGGRFTW
jgi:hypothetical protein